MSENPAASSEFLRKSSISNRALVLLFVALVAAASLALLGSRQTDPPRREAAGAVHSLAVLPVQLTGLKGDADWISRGGQLLLNQALQDLQEIRLLAAEDVNEALRLFQQEYPGAEDRQTQNIARLMGADYLLSTQITPAGDSGEGNRYRVLLKLQSLHAGSRKADTLADERVEPKALPAFFQRAQSLVRNALKINGKAPEETPLWSLDAERYTRAENAYALGQLQEARDLLGELLRSQPGYAPGWLLQARVQNADGEAEPAETSLREAATASRPGSMVFFQAQALSAQWQGDSEAAEIFLRRLIAAFPNHTAARMDLAALLMEQGLFEPAQLELQAVVELDPQHPRAWLELSKAAIVSGKAQRAVDEYLVEALAAYSRLQNLTGRGDVLNAFGVAYQRLGQWQQAQDYYLQGLELRRAEGDKRGQVISLGNLAALHSMRGEAAAAEEKLRAALEVAQDLNDDKARSEIYNQMGGLAEEQGHYRNALAHYREALAIRMRLEDVWLRAESQNNVGFIYFLLSDFDHAMVYWNNARDNFAEARDTLGEIQVQQNIAQLQLQRGNWPEAFRALRASEKLAKAEKLQSEEMVVGAYLGRLAFLQGRFKSAGASWDSAFEFVRERGDMRGTVEFGLWRAELSLALGQLQQASQQLAELGETLVEHGSLEQRVAEKLLHLQLAVHSEEQPRAEAIFAELTPLLGEEVPRSLRLRAKIAAAQLGLRKAQELDQVQWIDHPLEQLQWLEVKSVRQRSGGDWTGLEQSLAAARPLLKKVDGYWRGYIFDHLSFQLSQHRGRADLTARVSASRAYSNLLSQIADEDRAAFQIRNPMPQELAMNIN